METFGENSDLKEDLNISRNKNNLFSKQAKKKLIAIMIIPFLSLIIIGSLIIVFILLKKNNSIPNSDSNPIINPPEPEKIKKQNYSISGEINCIYSINDIKSNISLLSKDFENINNTIINIYINNNKIKSQKNLNFL